LITKQLESEKSTAANIKSTGTRKNVQDALESLIRITKGMKQTPKNGVGLFAGNVSKVEGQDDFITESFEPPEELNLRLYRCDQTFVLDPFEDMLEEKELYGLIVIDRKEAAIGILIGKKIRMLHHFDSFVPGKTTKGGQCLSPDTLIIINNEKKELGEVNIGDKILGFDFENNEKIETECVNKWEVHKDKIIKIFTHNNKEITASEDHLFFVDNDEGMVEKSANELLINEKLINENREREIIKGKEEILVYSKLIDIETKSHNFIANGLIVHNSAARYARIRDGLAKEFFRKVSEVVKKEFFDLKNLKGIIVGGPGPTKEDFLKESNLVTKLQDLVIGVKDIGYADEHGLEQLVEISSDLLAEQDIIMEKKLLEVFFNMLGKEKDKTAYGKEAVEKALEYGAVEKLLLSKKLKKSEIKRFTKKAEETNVHVDLVSNETEEGVQFLNLSGIGAILRFKI